VKKQTLSEFFESVYLPIRLRGRSPRTVTLYRASIAGFSGWLGRPALTADLEDTTVCRYLLSLESKLAALTIAKERSQLVAIWNCAARRRVVDGEGRTPRGIHPFATDEQLCGDSGQKVGLG
jgi:site-specific recombinase XerD